MNKALFKSIITFVSNHFELLITINGYIILLLVIVAVTVKLSDYSIRKLLLSTLRGALLTIIIAGQLVFFVFLGIFYWMNYETPAPEMQLAENMDLTTHWIKDNITVYFIKDHTLCSIHINGKNRKDVYNADSPIKEYHFSPDGQTIAIVTEIDLILVNRRTNEHRVIDTLKPSGEPQQPSGENKINGSISSVQWSPDSKRLSYEIARWSRYGSQDYVYIYTVNDRSKRSIKSPLRRISSLYWSDEGDSLYFLQHEARDTTISSSLYDVKAFRIPLETLTPELVARIPYDDASIPIENLALRGIHLYLEGSDLSFSLSQHEDHFISEQGSSVGVDDDDYLYFTGSKWFRRRLFKIPREEVIGDVPRYQYRGGDLAIDHIRWLPGGRYVIMDHKHFGVIILEPSSGRFGVLLEGNGRAFGWVQ